MLKKFSKLLSLLLIILTISSLSICYATEAVTTSETDTKSTTTTSATDNIHYGDLYLFDTNVVIDKIVYGNVYVFANTVEITGQIEGNLFVFANTVKLDNSVSNGGLVGGSIFACANTIYYNGACTYLYSVSNNIEMTYDSFVVRDAKLASINANIKAGFGRNVDLNCVHVNFGDSNEIPVVYGNLNYSAIIESEIPEGVILAENPEENITYTSSFSLANYSIKDIIIGFTSCIVTVLLLYFILNKYTTNFKEKIYNKKISALKLLKALGIGLLSLIIVSILSVLLLITAIGSKIAIILILLYVLLCLISVPILTIVITNTLKSTLKVEKTSIFCLILVLVSIILYGITLIPLAGILLEFILKILAIGLLIDIHIPHKELTDEEKAIVAEAKKQAKQNKEKRKEKKLEAKESKKQAKLETKKKDNNDL